MGRRPLHRCGRRRAACDPHDRSDRSTLDPLDPHSIRYTHFVSSPLSCDRKINEFVKRVRACKIHMLLVSGSARAGWARG